MRKSALAASAAAVLSVSALAATPLAVAAPAANAVPGAITTAGASEGAVTTVGVTGAIPPVRALKRSPVKQAHIRRYHLKRWELRQIAKSKRWAKTPKSRSVIRCESNFDYRLVDGPYHGAWQFLHSTWLGAGGGRYANNANRAPKFAQDHIAWKLWKRSGWGPWSCA